MPLPPPGWYPQQGQLRWWDGSAWTVHTQPLVPEPITNAAPAAAPAQTVEYGSLGKFRVYLLSEVLSDADEFIRAKMQETGRTRDRLFGIVAGRVMGEDKMLEFGLNYYLNDLGLRFVCSVSTDDDTLLVFASDEP